MSCEALVDTEDGEYYDDALDYIWQAIVINGAQLSLCLFAFALLFRWVPKARIAIAPRRSRTSVKFATLWEWLKQVWPTPYEDSDLSPDGLILVRLCDLGFRFSAIACVPGLAVLVPIYATGQARLPGILKLTLLNLGDADEARSWTSLAMAALLIFVALILLHREWRHFVVMRRNHLMRRARGEEGADAAQTQYSILVEQVPEELQDEDKLRVHFEELLFPVHSTVIQSNTSAWHRQLAEKGLKRCCGLCGSKGDGTAGEGGAAVGGGSSSVVEKADAKVPSDGSEAAKGHEEPGGGSHRVRQMYKDICSGTRVVQDLEHGALKLLQEGGIMAASPASSTAFVTFKEVRACVTAEQVILFKQLSMQHIQLTSDVCRIAAAPEARDMIWRNAAIPWRRLRQRSWIGWSMCAVGLFFWTIPVAGIQALASIDSWESPPGWLDDFIQSGVGQLIVGYLPVLALMLLLVALPYILQMVCDRVEGQKVKSVIQRQVLFRNLAFQIATLYCTVFAGNIARTMTSIADKPACLPEVLGQSIPKHSAYFVTFIIAKTGTSLPLLLVMPMLKGLWKQRKSGEVPSPLYCAFASEATQLAIVLILAFLYAIVCPLILPFAAVFFALAGQIYRWLFHNVYESEFDCTGLFWHELFDFLMAALLLAPISLAGVYATFEAKLATQLQVVWLLPIGVFSRFVSWYRLYEPLSRVLTYEDAVELDTKSSQLQVIRDFRSEYYLDPAICISRKLGAVAGAAGSPESPTPKDGKAGSFASATPSDAATCRNGSTPPSTMSPSDGASFAKTVPGEVDPDPPEAGGSESRLQLTLSGEHRQPPQTSSLPAIAAHADDQVPMARPAAASTLSLTHVRVTTSQSQGSQKDSTSRGSGSVQDGQAEHEARARALEMEEERLQAARRSPSGSSRHDQREAAGRTLSSGGSKQAEREQQVAAPHPWEVAAREIRLEHDKDATRQQRSADDVASNSAVSSSAGSRRADKVAAQQAPVATSLLGKPEEQACEAHAAQLRAAEQSVASSQASGSRRSVAKDAQEKEKEAAHLLAAGDEAVSSRPSSSGGRRPSREQPVVSAAVGASPRSLAVGQSVASNAASLAADALEPPAIASEASGRSGAQTPRGREAEAGAESPVARSPSAGRQPRRGASASWNTCLPCLPEMVGRADEDLSRPS